MKKQYSSGIVASSISLGVLIAGLSTVASATSVKQTPTHMQSQSAPHIVPNALQGKSRTWDLDPGITSTYSSSTKDIGLISPLRLPENLDKGMHEQYPPPQPPSSGSSK